MAADRDQEEEVPKGAPMWIVTFTDMISLLLTFFIMLLTFSSMEEEKMQQATGSLSGAFGIAVEGKRSKPEIQKQLDIELAEQDHKGVTDLAKRNEKIREAIRKVQDREIYNTKISVEEIYEGMRIKIEPGNNRELFDLSTDRIKTHTKALLQEVAKMFRTMNMRMVVETHVDSYLNPNQEDRRELSIGQAIAAARVLIENGMTPEMVAISPQGDFHPLPTGNETATDRYRNRRLEILVMPSWRTLDMDTNGGN